MQFEWDEEKGTSNLSKHGVSFEDAVTVFGDPLSDALPDPDHSFEDQRFIIIGSTESGKILVVAHTDDSQTVRIISAREATHGERQFYEEG
ncbi:MAG TPA: BrnT family toxin [Pyrinomonadaceae bacterium]|nr:BrnT family toxin [Pyrinomonadaceae bacterium]